MNRDVDQRSVIGGSFAALFVFYVFWVDRRLGGFFFEIWMDSCERSFGWLRSSDVELIAVPLAADARDL